MSNASDSTVEQTKEIIYTVILLNFTKREKNASDDLQVEKKLGTELYYTVTRIKIMTAHTRNQT